MGGRCPYLTTSYLSTDAVNESGSKSPKRVISAENACIHTTPLLTADYGNHKVGRSAGII